MIVPQEATTSTSAIDLMFHSLLSEIDKQNWENARATALQIQKSLLVTSGRLSRQKGGWQYSPSYVIDSVVFADLLRHLQDKQDVMTRAVHVTLSAGKFTAAFLLKFLLPPKH